jgi:two-component system, OmpR family, sensor histidine kinase BaeS
MKKIRSLNIHTAFILIFISIFSVGTVSVISNIGTNIKFKKYIKEKHEKRDIIIKDILKNSYNKYGKFDKKAIEMVDMYCMMDNLRVNIIDKKGESIWRADYIGHIMKMDGLATMGKYSSHKKKMSIEKFEIISDGKKIGSVEIAFDGEYTLSKKDINFLNEFNNWVIFSGVISVIFSFLLSRIFAMGIVKPIKKINEGAKRIENGELDIEIEQESRISEAVELTNTINRMAKSLREQKQLRRQLVSDMSHEIRTPLATIQSHIEAIIDEVWEPTTTRIESIYEEIKRLAKLVKDIEKIEEIESSNLKLEKRKFLIGEVVIGVINNFQAEAVFKNIGIVIEKIEDGVIEADIDKFKQVLVNIISNSIKYSKSSGNIWVSIINRDEKKILIIKDNGVGIAKEHLPYIFERFYRVDSSRARVTGGMGIGLAVVKSIVEAHNWKINIKSIEDKGSEIELEIIKEGDISEN